MVFHVYFQWIQPCCYDVYFIDGSKIKNIVFIDKLKVKLTKYTKMLCYEYYILLLTKRFGSIVLINSIVIFYREQYWKVTRLRIIVK